MSETARTQDFREGLELIQEDMAEHQRKTRGEVTGEANRALAVAEFEKLDKVLPPPALPPAPMSRQEKRELERKAKKEVKSAMRQVDGRSYTVTKDAETGPALQLPKRQREESVKILKRLHYLLTLPESGIAGAPSWAAKAKKVLDIWGVQRNYKKFCRHLDELLEESNKYFGNWQVDPDARIVVGPGS